MLSIHPSALQRQAEDALRSATYNPKKLALLHTAVALGSSLLVTIINFFLSRQIADTGGLAGLGLRSTLSTVQSVLEFVVMFALPFWEIGLIFAALGWSRKEHTGPGTLLQGFYRFRSVFGLNLLRILLLFVIGFPIFYFITALYMFTPLSEPLWELLEPIANSNMTPQEVEAFLTPEMLQAMMRASVPMLIMFGIVYAVVAIFLFYRLRFAEYALSGGMGAFKSLWHSVRLTAKKRSIGLLKTDLHFWWYYLALAFLSVLSFADVFLIRLGVSLPLSADAASILFCLVAGLCQVAFCWQYQATVSTTYALLYKEFDNELTAGVAKTTPIDVPWST